MRLSLDLQPFIRALIDTENCGTGTIAALKKIKKNTTENRSSDIITIDKNEYLRDRVRI